MFIAALAVVQWAGRRPAGVQRRAGGVAASAAAEPKRDRAAAHVRDSPRAHTQGTKPVSHL